ncbi:MAG: LuxR C-terminal-related transcriptional regulator [Candidatus Limnocylindrales bacterium]|nr:LuxR C-terminal-related transcriptional regulator [Candidatus Limnocylindrales bacterium]
MDSRAPSHGGAVAGPLVYAKLRAPAAGPGHRERSRISALLDRGLEDGARLTLLSAPPGYGKTVAVVGWLQSRGVACAWLSLDPADNDLARFTRYLMAAMRAARPEIGDAAEGLFGPGVSPSIDLVGATLLDEIAATDNPFVLVIDDYQLVTIEPVHRLVRFVIERGPPFVHLVLLTREDPPLPLARLRAHGQLVELRADDLRWGRDEASTYLGGLGASLAPPLVERLVERTEGWIAGLQLAAVSLRDRADPAALIDMFGGSQRFVFDYLADEVLGGVDEDLRTFLVRTSIAERFTAELGRELTGRTDADALLERAERANLFIVPLDAERRWYRYHRLFADYLRSQVGEDERRSLHERAADWFERMGFESDAIEHALAASSLDRAVRLIERAARPAFESGEIAALLGWFEAVAADRVAQSPDLVSLHAWALFETGQIGAAVALAERHLASSRVRGPAEGRLLVLRALMATVTGPDAEDLAIEGLGLVGDDPLFRSFGLLAAGLSGLARGEYMEAVTTLRVAYQTALQVGYPLAVLPAVSPLGQALALAGLRGEAETICRTVLAQQADEQGRPRPIAWPARVVLGMTRYEANDIVEARRELEAGFDAARRMGVGRPVLGWAISYLALVRLAFGDQDGAREALSTSRRDLRTTGMALPGLAGEIEARILLRQGDVAGAARWADRATPDAPPSSPLLELVRRSMDTTIARVRLAQGSPDAARELLARTRAAQEASGAVADLISIGVLETACADAAGRRADALRTLEQAVELAAPGNYVRRFVDDGRSIAHLLPLVRAVAPAFVDTLIAALAAFTAFAAVPTETDSARPHVPTASVWQDADGRLLETLTARELDVLRLMAKGASNAAIAAGLTVSLGTAKWHVGHVLAKLGATSRTQALLRAQQVGLV